MKDKQSYKQQLEGRLAKYTARMQEGLVLDATEQSELRHIKRRLYYLDHSARYQARRVSFKNIRRCLDNGVI